jgi:hypothetical protein
MFARGIVVERPIHCCIHVEIARRLDTKGQVRERTVDTSDKTTRSGCAVSVHHAEFWETQQVFLNGNMSESDCVELIIENY